MPLCRFKIIRKVFDFRAALPAIERGSAARILPLMNLLKRTGGSYIEIGRDIVFDECIVTFRSKFGRHVIMFYPMKSTGKHIFFYYIRYVALLPRSM